MKNFLTLCLVSLLSLATLPVCADNSAEFPVFVTTADGLPGTDNGSNYVWTSPVYTFNNAINGVRLTFFEVQGNVVAYNNFPVVALGEVEFYDGNGNQIAYTVENVTTNSLASDDGSLGALCDGDHSTHYHSTWSGAGTTPNEFVYLDIAFPDSVSTLQYAQVARMNDALMPVRVGITPLGEKCDVFFSGTFGDSISWSLKNGELAINGCGTIPEYSYSEYPWYSYRNYITKVIIGDSIKNVPSYAFCDYYYAYKIENVYIGDAVTTIGDNAFYECDALKSFETGRSVTTIGASAFYSCNALRTVVIGDSVTTMGSNVFQNCGALTDVTIGASLTLIPEYAFRYCSNLRMITLNAVTPPYVGDYAFNNTNLSFVYVPEGYATDYKNATFFWSNYLIMDNENGVTVSVTLDEAGLLGDSVLAQVENFSDVNTLIVSGVLNSDDYYNIKNRMTGLVNVDLSAVEVTYLENELFYGKTYLQKVVLPETLEYIADRMFYNCYMLKEVTMPSSLKSIGTNSFYHCSSLKEAIIPEGVTGIGTYAFAYCSSLENVSLPSTLATIPERCFYQCTGLENLSLADGLTAINTYAFSGCTSLKELVCPSTLWVINHYAFYNCTSLESLSLNEGLDKLESYTFYNCDKLTEVVLPSTLTYCCQPFADCNGISKITCLALLPPYLYSDYDILYGVEKDNCVLYVPEWTVNRYKQTDGWDDFPTIKPLQGYIPQNIYVHDAEKITLPDGLTADTKTNVTLMGYFNTNMSSYTYGALEVDGNSTLSIGNFKMSYDPNYYYQSPSNSTCYSALVNNAGLRADSVQIEMVLRNDKWFFVSFPFDVKVSDIQPLYSETNFVIRKYSGEARANGETGTTWVDMTVDSILHAGVGYIWQSSRYNSSGSWQQNSAFYVKAINNTNKNNIFANSDVTVELEEYISEFAHNRSWNLVGNPYPCFYDTRFMEFTAPLTVWSESNSTYVAYSPIDDEYILRPGEAFFVQRPVDSDAIVFSTDGRQIDKTVRTLEATAPAATRSVNNSREVINITLSDNNHSDRTRVVINENAQMAYETACDAGKFMSSDAQIPQIYTIDNGVKYAINERPIGDAAINLGVYTGNDGEYTISLSSDIVTKVILTDKQTGEQTCLNNADYIFFATAGTYEERFVIELREAVTAVESVSLNTAAGISVADGVVAVAIDEPSQITLYTIDGRTVGSVFAPSVSFVTAPGVYILNIAGVSHKVVVK